MDNVFHASTEEKHTSLVKSEQKHTAHLTDDLFPEDLPAGCTDTRQIFKVIPKHILRFMGIPLSTYLKNNKLTEAIIMREFLEDQDWSVLESSYKREGRPGYSPKDMVGLILYGITKGKDSLRELAKLARSDLGAIWVCQGIRPDYTTLSKFISRHGEDLTTHYFEVLTQKILKKAGIKSTLFAADGTTIEAASSCYNTLKSEALNKRLDELEKKNSKDGLDQPKVEKYRELKKELDKRNDARVKCGKEAVDLRISPHEPEAYVQPTKRRRYLSPAYKSSVISTNGRIVVGYDIDPTSETKVVFDMINQAKKITCTNPDWLLCDAGYHTGDILLGAKKIAIPLLIPEGKANKKSETGSKQSKKMYMKNQFKYDAQEDSYVCPQGNKLEKKYDHSNANPAYTVYGTKACQGCPVKELCTKNKKGREIKRYEFDGIAEEIKAKLNQEEYKQIYRQRQAIVEPVFGNLRENQKFNRYKRVGIKKAKIELGLHLIAHNLSRLVALLAFILLNYLIKIAIFTKMRAKSNFVADFSKM